MFTEMQCVRILHRVWEPIGKRLADGEAADYGFDYGEYSASAWDRIVEEEWDACVERTARKLGVDPSDLARWNTEASYREMEYYYGV